MDSLFVFKLDLCKLFELDIGIFSLDQEKEFDRVDNGYSFSVLKAFSFQKHFV